MSKEKTCVFCRETKNENVINFTDSHLQSCHFILERRKLWDKIYRDVELPEIANSTEGYHANCYSLFTALKAKFRNENPKSAQEENNSSETQNSELSGAVIR